MIEPMEKIDDGDCNGCRRPVSSCHCPECLTCGQQGCPGCPVPSADAPQAQEEPGGAPAPGVSEGAKRAVSEVARSLEAICKVADPIIAKYQPPAPASPGGLVWTKQKPTQPGWYWLRHKGWEDPGDFSIECFWLEGRELLNEYNQRPEDAGYEWAGPIPEPAAPEAGAPGTRGAT